MEKKEENNKNEVPLFGKITVDGVAHNSHA